MSELYSYEGLCSSASIWAEMGAGALAGVVEHSFMFPLDSVKTRMQSLVIAGNPSLVYTFRNMIASEGSRSTLRGLNVMMMGAGPAHALYFATYEQVKEAMSKTIITSPKAQPIVHGIAGSLATLFHDAIMTPADAVKQRMQMNHSPYTSSMACIRQIYKEEGPRAFYRSYTTQLTMNIPFQALHFVVYEFMQKVTNKERRYNPTAHCISGALAGAVAASVTTPLDVCKTLLNTQESSRLANIKGAERGKEVRGLLQAARIVYEVKGLQGFFRGMSARVLYQMPGTALSWSVYEFFKYFIQGEIDQHRNTKTPIPTSSVPPKSVKSPKKAKRSWDD